MTSVYPLYGQSEFSFMPEDAKNALLSIAQAAHHAPGLLPQAKFCSYLRQQCS